MQRKLRDRILEVPYFICYILYTTLSIIAFSPAYDKLEHLLTQEQQFLVANWGAFAILSVIFLFKHHDSLKEVALELIIAAIFITATFLNQTVQSTFYLTQWTMYGTAAMFAICATVTTLRRIAVVSAITSVLTVIAFQYGAYTEYLINLTSVHLDKTAHYMGFLHYAHPSYFLVFAWIAYMYARGKKQISYIELIGEAMLLYAVHEYTTSRLGSILTLLAMVLYIIFVKLDLIKLHWKFTRFMATASFSICALFTLLTGYFYNPKIAVFKKLNQILTGRVRFVHMAYDRWDIQLLGRLITWQDNGKYFYLDSGYAMSLFGGGLLYFTAVMGMYTYMCWSACKRGDRPFLVWLLAVAAAVLVGDPWVHIAYTPLILGFFITLREDRALDKLSARLSAKRHKAQYKPEDKPAKTIYRKDR
ncbi:MAG: hypothetical protein IKA10_00875 [Oscillospiraceae bacterium]|nr:hypothetical protein [Oscillospiraceae bacterium]